MPHTKDFIRLFVTIALFVLPAAIFGNMVFKRNDIPVFQIRSDGSVWFSNGYKTAQTDAVEGGELKISDPSFTRILWTKTNNEIHIKGSYLPGQAIPSSSLRFSYNAQEKAGVSPTTGNFYPALPQFIVTVRSIKFNHTTSGASNDAINIRQDYATPIQTPEYFRNTRSSAAAYLAGKTVSIKAVFEVQPNSVQSLVLQGISNDNGGSLGNTGQTTVPFSNGLSSEVQLDINGQTTPSCVWKSQDFWDWNVVDGALLLFMETTGPHTIYTVLNDAVAPWSTDDGNQEAPWVTALDFAIDPLRGNMQGATTVATAASRIATCIFFSYGLNYDIFGGAPKYFSQDRYTGIITYDLTNYLIKGKGNVVNCYDQAGAENLFIWLIGGMSDYRFMSPYGFLNLTDLIGVGSCNNPFFGSRTSPYNVPVVGQDDANRTYFGNHAFVRLDGYEFDACAGPHTGQETEAEYVTATIDRSTPEEDALDGDIGNISTRIILNIQ
jgi:hypothetical protein